MCVLRFDTQVFGCVYDVYFGVDVGVVFFFQAEDGIRYLVRSRGLGDGYKRQGLVHVVLLDEFQDPVEEPQLGVERVIGRLGLDAVAEDEAGCGPGHDRREHDGGGALPVSYTHLTLPTSDLV